MGKEADIADALWKGLRSDRTFLLGLPGVDDGHSQPMTAMFDGDGKPAIAHFVAKGHDLFAALHGALAPVQDDALVDRLWNPFVAAWYPGGRDDPQLRLLRFDPERAQVWLNENSLLTGIKLLLGRDPKREYADKVAEFKVG